MPNDEKALPSMAKEAEAVSKKAGASNVSGDYFADFDFGSIEADMKAMLKNGVHFGHQKSRRNPKMEEYIFGTKNGINIINLSKTVEKSEEAKKFIHQIIMEGKDILFIGTKKQSKNLVVSLAKRLGMPYVVERWLGGTFTNYKIISNRTRFLRDGEDKMRKGEFSQYTKFEQMKIGEELEKLESKMGGIKNMMKLPGAIFVTGVIEDNLAILEARKKNIPIIGIVDTNVDPSNIDYPIPANDDAVSSLRFILSYIGKAVLEAKAASKAVPAVEGKK